MANDERRRGFCPRVWTPMESGDGLLVRVHAATRWFAAREIEQLVELARLHGNGLIEITRRANLQLRGVRPNALPALQRALVRMGLAPQSAEGERCFALHATPWLGLDPACAPLAPLLAQLERLLSDATLAVPIHPKLAIVLSGPRAALSTPSADLAVTLVAEQPAWVRIDVGLTPRARHTLGLCRVEDVPEWVAGWIARLGQAPAEASVDWQGQRMHDWIAQHGRAALDRHAPRSLSPSAEHAPRVDTNAPADWLGFHAGQAAWFGVMLPFGAGDAAEWRALAALCARHGDGSLRTHPERGLLLRGVPTERAPALATALAERGLCVRADEALTRVVACAGAPACTSARGETRQLARQLALAAHHRLARGATLHVSGCEKSCARTASAEIVVLHGADGAHLAFDGDVRDAARAPARTLPQLRALLSARDEECATPAPYPALEPDVP